MTDRIVSSGGGGLQKGWPRSPKRRPPMWGWVIVALGILAMLALLYYSAVAQQPKPIAETIFDLGTLVEREDRIGGALLVQVATSFQLDKVRQAHDCVKGVNEVELKKRGEK